MTTRTRHPNPVFLSYLAAIKNSRGSKIFRDFYAVAPNGRLNNVTKRGRLSCAYFVSGLLKMFDLINRVHLTVTKTETALQRAGWKLIKRPKVGSVLIWEEKKFGHSDFHYHIGFYIGHGQAISNSYFSQTPKLHHWQFARANNPKKRKIIAIYWHKSLMLQ